MKLSANNKDKVIVRLIAGNGLVSNWNLKQLTVSAEKDESSQGISAKDATVAWPFNEGASNPTSAEASVPELCRLQATLSAANLRSTAHRSATLK